MSDKTDWSEVMSKSWDGMVMFMLEILTGKFLAISIILTWKLFTSYHSKYGIVAGWWLLAILHSGFWIYMNRYKGVGSLLFGPFADIYDWIKTKTKEAV